MKKLYCDVCNKAIVHTPARYAYIGDDGNGGVVVTVDVQWSGISTADPQGLDLCQACFRGVMKKASKQWATA